MSTTEGRIGNMIRRAHQTGQPVNDLVAEIDLGQLNDTDQDTTELVQQLAGQRGLGW